MTEPIDLQRDAREIFAETLASIDAGKAVREAVATNDSSLRVVDTNIPLKPDSKIYSVAIGKAAAPMATVLDNLLGERLIAGVISSPARDVSLSKRWQVFTGGHPVPNAASVEAARAAFDLLDQADDASSIIIFLISGGGSAMMEKPRDQRITLDELRETNHLLVSCGASIAEINSVRRSLSSVKGGGLSAVAPRATQISLIVSDTNPGDEANVASGPTLSPQSLNEDVPNSAAEILARYDLALRLPSSVVDVIRQSTSLGRIKPTGLERHYVLLDNTYALRKAAQAARARGFEVEIASDLIEQPIAEGCAALLSRLIKLRKRYQATKRSVCLISGGEFACPVRGTGRGGRNSETALRSAIEIADYLKSASQTDSIEVAILSGGTDGIDGNSPAAGAIATHDTIKRAEQAGLDAQRFLENSDSYTFFESLGDAIITGPTGTNVRDIRIMLAR